MGNACPLKPNCEIFQLGPIEFDPSPVGVGGHGQPINEESHRTFERLGPSTLKHHSSASPSDEGSAPYNYAGSRAENDGCSVVVALKRWCEASIV
jgi:hypothetical protein